MNLKNAGATTYTWSGGSSGNWTTAANWGGSGYPSGSGDIAQISTSNVTITFAGTATISQLKVSAPVTGVTISLSASSSLTISSGLNIGQPGSASNVIIFSGSGSATINGTSSFAYTASMAITSGANVTFGASSIIDFSNNQGTLNNGGTLNLSSGCNFKLAYASKLANASTGTVNATSNTFTMSGSPSYISNAGVFNATSSTFTVSGSGCTISNTGTFNTTVCTLTSTNSGNYVTNTGTFRDIGSNLSFTGQTNGITNTGTSANFRASITTIGFSAGNNNHSITNSGTFQLDSGAVANLGTQSCTINNSGIFNAGTKYSGCTINLTGQSANITNTATFNEGSTSVISPSGISALVNNSSGTFTLQSDQNGSATISALSSGASCSGTFSVQRFLTGGSGYRGYRLLSSQVYVNSVSGVNVYSINYLKNSIYLTGTSITGGFDNTTATANPTLYLFRENLTPSFSNFLNSNFIGISKINNSTSYNYSVNDPTYTSTYNLPVGSGYLCFFRGDRSTSLASKTTAPYPVPESTTLMTTGSINTGTIVVRNWFSIGLATLSFTTATPTTYKGYNLVGNPYPSTIDWNSFSSSTSSAAIYGPHLTGVIALLNPNGSYGTYSLLTHLGNNNGTRYIPSGAGFFVQADTTGSSLTFREGAKTNTQVTGSNLFMGHPPTDAIADTQYLRLQMAMDSFYNEDIVVNLNRTAKANFDVNEDAMYKIGTCKVNMNSLSADNIPLAINQVPFPKTSMTISLNIGAATNGTYSMNMKEIVRIPLLFDIWLMDAYRKDSVDMRHNTTYKFDVIKTDSSSFGNKRFTLVIRQNSALVYHLLSFAAIKGTGKQTQIIWTTQNEGNYTNFTIERSIDGGKTYTIVGGVPANGSGQYGLPDKNPSDQNLYRLKQEDINDSITYSRIVAVNFSALNNTLAINSVNVYPNPAKSILNVNIPSKLYNGIYNITIVNSSGAIIKQVVGSQSSWQTNVGDLSPGTYVVKVLDSKANSYVGDAKFIKN